MNKTTDTNLWGIHAGKSVAEDIEETTRGFVLKRLAQELKGNPLADFVAYLLNTRGCCLCVRCMCPRPLSAMRNHKMHAQPAHNQALGCAETNRHDVKECKSPTVKV